MSLSTSLSLSGKTYKSPMKQMYFKIMEDLCFSPSILYQTDDKVNV